MVRPYWFGRPVTLLAWVCCLVLLGQWTTGCAADPSKSDPVATTKSDIVTDSDEAENRAKARRYLTLAVLYFNDNKPTIALDILKQSIAADPEWFESHNLRGLIYMRLNNAPLAENSFKRALVLNPDAAPVQHNYGRLLCKQSRANEGLVMFARALVNPLYNSKAKTWMAQGECQLEAGQRLQAETSFLRSYELDPGNPFTAYNLSLLLFQRGDMQRAQFYIRRLNGSEFANAESLWLGAKVERSLGNQDMLAKLGAQLKKQFPQSREALAFERGSFDE